MPSERSRRAMASGVTIAPFGAVNGQFGSGDWTFAVQSSGTLPSVTLRADGPELPPNINRRPGGPGRWRPGHGPGARGLDEEDEEKK